MYIILQPQQQFATFFNCSLPYYIDYLLTNHQRETDYINIVKDNNISIIQIIRCTELATPHQSTG